ncbi:MAG: hypothetical protein OXG56_00295 [Gammaproteobacteria bacterium]|nr:hypothetical protein [Gammaproteobacteria bacterium]
MPDTLRIILRICLFRAYPQDLPAAGNRLVSVMALALGLFMVRNSQLAENVNVLSLSLAQVLLLGAGLAILLFLFRKPERWLQSATALYGCSALLLVFTLPFVIMTNTAGLASDTLGLPKLMIILSSFWYFAVIVFILRQTLEINLVFALVITLVLELSFAVALMSLFGELIL